MRRLLAVLLASSWAADASSAAVYVAPVAPAVAPLGASIAGAGLAAPRPGQTLLAAPVTTLAAPSFSPTLAASALPSLRPALSLPAPALAAPVVRAAAAAAAPGQAAASGAAAPHALIQSLTERVAAIEKAGGAQAAPAVNGVSAEEKIVNDEGVAIFGRPPAYYLEVRRIVDRYKGRLDLSESLDVMDDSYGDAWAKLAAIEALAKSRRIEDHNTRLDGTLLWVDGVLQDRGRRIAVNTTRVYFHHAANPRSEIEEGLRRVDGYLKEVVPYFSRGGKAEQALGRLDEVVLTFDTRGYAEIKDALKARAAALSKADGGRIRFAYLDELVPMPKDIAETRQRLNGLVKRFGRMEGLGKIIEGVVYGRYVGMLLELKTLEYYLEKGWEVLQSGHELFDAQGLYVTELDAVVRDPASGRVTLVEAKSARVPIPFEDALKEKVIRKLETYAKHRARLEAEIGHPVDEVVFSFDVGRNTGLILYLKARAASLSKKYGFNVSFLFLNSGPAQDRQGRGRR